MSRIIILIVGLNVVFIVAALRGQWALAILAAVVEAFLVLRSRGALRGADAADGAGGNAGTDGPDRGDGAEAQLPPLEGTVDVAGLVWDVTEERRGGPWSQLLVLKARDAGSGVMHVRPAPGEQARSLSDVEALAINPALRYLTGPDGVRWQSRIVQGAGEGGTEIPVVKFISRENVVREGPFTGIGGLGQRTDEELRRLLERSEQV